MMLPPTDYWFERSAAELGTSATTLAAVASELSQASRGMQAGDPEALRQRAIALQAESMRALFAVMAARCVSERLTVLASFEEHAASRGRKGKRR